MGGLGDAINTWYASNNNLINDSGLNAILALSVYVMLACGLLSLASPAYMAIGAYTAALLSNNTGVPFPLQMAAGALLAAGVAFILGLPLLRLRGVYLAICTVGFVAIVQIFFNTWTPGGAGNGISIPAATTTWQIYAVLVVLCFLLWRLEGSALGRSLAAIRLDEEAARSLGIDTIAFKLGAFALSGALAGLMGVLYARLHYYIDPQTFGFETALAALTYVVVGGSLTTIGSPLGAILITALPEWLRGLNGYRTVVNGLILLAVILFLPGGLVDLPRRLSQLVCLGIQRLGHKRENGG
jgi:branched-chain amino acid transport system permease protein